jgi:hypothetical protein
VLLNVIAFKFGLAEFKFTVTLPAVLPNVAVSTPRKLGDNPGEPCVAPQFVPKLVTSVPHTPPFAPVHVLKPV